MTQDPVMKDPIPSETLPAVQAPPTTTSQSTQTRSPIAANDRGLLVGGTFEEQFRLARAYCQSGLVPRALDTPEKVLVAIQFARELGLQPVTAMRQICVINGTPALWGDLPLSLVMKSGLLAHISEELTDTMAKCTVQRKLMQPVTRTYTMEEARAAGLTGKDTWKKFPKRMLQCRARAWALKDVFPDVLNSAPVAEYDYDVIPDGSGEAVTVDRTAERRSSLNDKFAPVAHEENNVKSD